MKPITIQCTVNHQPARVTTLPNRTLLEILREDLALTSVKDACGGEGECGACTVLVNGQPVNSCLVLAPQVEGMEVLTVEGLTREEVLHPIQRAFVEAGAVQCGFCTPGAVLATKALLDTVPDPSDAQIEEALSGNLCRCTGYVKMLVAVHQAAEELRHAH